MRFRGGLRLQTIWEERGCTEGEYCIFSLNNEMLTLALVVTSMQLAESGPQGGNIDAILGN